MLSSIQHLYFIYVFLFTFMIYALLLLYKLITNSISQRLFYLAGSMEL